MAYKLSLDYGYSNGHFAESEQWQAPTIESFFDPEQKLFMAQVDMPPYYAIEPIEELQTLLSERGFARVEIFNDVVEPMAASVAKRVYLNSAALDCVGLFIETRSADDLIAALTILQEQGHEFCAGVAEKKPFSAIKDEIRKSLQTSMLATV